MCVCVCVCTCVCLPSRRGNGKLLYPDSFGFKVESACWGKLPNNIMTKNKHELFMVVLIESQFSVCPLTFVGMCVSQRNPFSFFTDELCDSETFCSE